MKTIYLITHPFYWAEQHMDILALCIHVLLRLGQVMFILSFYNLLKPDDVAWQIFAVFGTIFLIVPLTEVIVKCLIFVGKIVIWTIEMLSLLHQKLGIQFQYEQFEKADEEEQYEYGRTYSDNPVSAYSKALALFGFSSSEQMNLQRIKQRYRELMKECHPDAGGDEELAKEINEAFSILKDVI